MLIIIKGKPKPLKRHRHTKKGFTYDPSYSDNDSNEIYVYDTDRQAWLDWAGINFMGGITTTSEEVYFVRRESLVINMAKMLGYKAKPIVPVYVDL